ncbi:MAG: SufD family Fe-S cluster assembly protein, partial [Terracidiphilus sp.]
ATIGQIDEAQLFYLRARGIAEAEARNLLLYAFAGECLDRMKEPAAREFAEGLIRERLHELASAFKTDPLAASKEEEAQHWEEVG